MNLDSIKNIKIADFDYPLPDSRIARHPLAVRDACLLLVAHPNMEISDSKFSSLPELVPPDSLLICNDTRVINARINFRKLTGSKIEIFLLEPDSPTDYVEIFQTTHSCRWKCLVGNLKRWKDSELEKSLTFNNEEVKLSASKIEQTPDGSVIVEFSWNNPDITFASIVDAAGYIPIPPYLKRESESSDADDYQTIYARLKGSVAAPTAGLHFTPELFDRLREHQVEIAPVTLHVGAGTFQPVKSEAIGEHPMHTETFSIERNSLSAIANALRANRPITAVGTTSVRTLESLPIIGRKIGEGNTSLSVSQWEAYSDFENGENSDNQPFSKDKIADFIENIIDFIDKTGASTITCSTSIMIAPGFRWNIVDNIITNFHQPQSTLLLLVSSFLGKNKSGEERWLEIYRHALAKEYRFLSYGDACFFSK